MRLLFELQTRSVDRTSRCLNRWVSKSLGVNGISDDLERTKRQYKIRPHQTKMFSLLSWILHIPASLALTLPTIGYIMTLNTTSNDPPISWCDNSNAVVAFKIVLQLLLLQPLTSGLVKLRFYRFPPNEIVFNTKCSETLFLLQFLAEVFWPVLITFLLDE